MALEVGTRIADLVATNPLSSDPAGQGDDHLRLLKACIQGSLPNMGGILGQLRSQDVAVSLSSAWNTSHILVSNSATATVVLTLPPASSITTGFVLDIITLVGATVSLLPSGANVSINGAASLSIPQASWAHVVYDGADWWAAVGPTGNGGFILTGNLIVNGNLSVSGASNFGGAVTISGAATLLSTLSVSGATVLTGVVAARSAVTLDSTLSVSGAATFKSAASFSAAVTLGSTLTVSGVSVLQGAVTLASTLSVSGAAHMNTTLSVGGAATLASTLSVSGAVNFNTTLNVQGATTLSGGVTMKGVMSISGLATFGTSINVSGTAVFGGPVTISGAVTMLAAVNVSNGQINFPAVQNPAAGANTLDDYEEGTWTPSINYATTGNLNIVYSLQSAQYTKVGRKVTAHFTMGTSTYTHTTAASTMIINGFPFTPTFAGFGQLSFEGMLIATSPNYDGPVLRCASGSTSMALTKSGINNNGRVDLDPASHTSGTNVSMDGSITYDAS